MSLMTREDMLRELELLPVWQLREPLPAQGKPQVSDSPVAGDEIPAAEAPPASADIPQVAEIALEQAMPEAVAPIVTQEEQPPMALRVLLSEDAAYAFLLATAADAADTQAEETLLQNMLKAMKVACREDVRDADVSHISGFAPKVIICLGDVPANALSGRSHNVAEWRSMHQAQPVYHDAIPLVVTYPLAHLLAHMADKAKTWEDLCFARKIVQNL